MRGLKLTLPILALIVLSACGEEETYTLTLGGESSMPQGFRQSECLELQRQMDDPNLATFTRNGARDSFNDKDCVYRPQANANRDSAGIVP